MHAYRTHTCGQLRKADVGGTVRLSGWVNRRRDHGGLIFIDLRDHYGITQCVIEPDAAAFALVDAARSEWVLTLTGKVVARTAETVNSELPTGEVELRIENCAVQGRAQELPMPVFGDHDYPEETRLTYRFLDLRRERLHKEHHAAGQYHHLHPQADDRTRLHRIPDADPDGVLARRRARLSWCPSRRYPGQFYALPQAPQQFKQLIMVSGFDRYFQIAPCFRDEDGRADRSPGEFYQLDLEMSFVTQDDVFAAVEPVLAGVFEEFADGKAVTKPPFVRIAFAEAMLKYGTDKPDLRNPIEIVDVSEIFGRAEVEFKAFKNKTVRAIPAPGAAGQPRSFFDKLNEWARGEGAAGLGYIQFEEENGALIGKGPIAKFIPASALADMAKAAKVKAGDALFFSADAKTDRAANLAGMARTRLGRELNLIPNGEYKFCWIVDFPMYEWNEDDKKIDFSHNPFSMPQMDREKFLALDNNDNETILGLKAYQYDIVCNGYELSSGAIRNHDPDVMLKAFEIAGYAREETEEKFKGMLNAFRYGAPPHGGTAPGIDRIVMLLAGEENLREVTMFPMTQQAQDLLMNAPSEANPKQLKELHLRVVYPEK